MSELNPLEKAVLEWVSESTEDSALVAQIATATLKSREWTKVGFHIDLLVDKSCPAVALSTSGAITRLLLVKFPSSIKSIGIPVSLSSTNAGLHHEWFDGKLTVKRVAGTLIALRF